MGRPASRGPVAKVGLHQLSQLARREGLLHAWVLDPAQERASPGVKAPPVRNTIRSASSGAGERHLLVQIHAAHLRHHDVAEDEIVTLAARQLRQGLARARERHHLVLRRSARRWPGRSWARHPRSGCRPRARGRTTDGGRAARTVSSVAHGGQDDAEDAALAHLALQLHPPAEPGDDAAADGQPQPRAHAAGLGGEERLEHPLQRAPGGCPRPCRGPR